MKIDENFKTYFTRELTQDKIEKLIALAQKSELSQIVTTIDLLLVAQNKLFSFLLPQLALEIAIIKATQKIQAPELPLARATPTARIRTAPLSTPEKQTEAESSRPQPTKRAEINSAVNLDTDMLKSRWNRLLVEIRPHNHSLCALLTNCQIKTTEGNVITLATPYEFYKEKLDDPQNRLTIEEVFSKILELAVRIQVVVDKTLAPVQKSSADEELQEANEKENTANHEQSSLLSSAMEIMGGKIVE